MGALARLCLCLTVVLASRGPALGQRFYPDDPVWIDPDHNDIPEPVARDISKAYDFLESTFIRPEDRKPRPAVNVNTLGEVPDSSWFTNRIGRRGMSIEELVRGPDRRGGPDRSRPWKILSGKDEGDTPGLWIEDARGDVYLLKFDPRDHPQLTTSAEVISTKFFYAAGYYVPENYLVHFTPEQLQLQDDAEFTDRYGVERNLKATDLEKLLERIPRLPGGGLQAMASLELEGNPLGPFKFYGTRADDPNDVFPHEDRRELRGYRLFSAWLNHTDSDAANTLDMLVEEDGKQFIRHHLIDFGTALGAGAAGPKIEFAGFEYVWEPEPLAKTALTLGFWRRPWMSAEYPDFPSVGHFESKHFHPGEWKPDYPNPAFEKMDLEDAFWATRILMRFTDERIRAVVGTGRWINPHAEAYVGRTLIDRRDKIVEYYLRRLNPLDEFALRGSGSDRYLEFRNLGLEAGLSAGAHYQYRWFALDNGKELLEPMGADETTGSTSIALPRVSGLDYIMVRIRTLSPGLPQWETPVDVYIRLSPVFSIVGIDRFSR